MSGSSPRVTGLVLAAGGSKRLGRPKQLLPYGAVPLLAHVLAVARQCAFDQLLCVLGAGAGEVRARIGLEGVQVVENPHFGQGCASSIAEGIGAVDPRCDVLVLMLGDQPAVTAATVATLLCGRGRSPLAACAYADGRGHPLAFDRTVFGELAGLHGDRGVWKLLERHSERVVGVPVPGLIPPDIDTWEDYESVRLAHEATDRE